MTVLAAMDDPAIKVSGIELETPDRPYTFQTIESLRVAYGPEAILFFVMGADSFEELSTWRRPERVLADANLIVATRPGHSVEPSHLAPEFRERIRMGPEGKPGTVPADERSGAIYMTELVNVDISSTEIRRRARDGESIDELVPLGVAQYIRKYELYRR
jgi:nicotinate-nucleotide adenylyltransferase